MANKDSSVDEILKQFLKDFDEGGPISPLGVARNKLEALIAEQVKAGNEIFIPVKGYEGLYEVSNTGKVRSVKIGRRSGKELKQAGRGGKAISYKAVSLCKNGTSKSRNVHRLVAEAFLSNPEAKRTVNHIDCDPSNNNLSNLEWATYAENSKHAYDNGRIQIWNKGKKLEPIKECLRGHLFTPENTYFYSDGERACRACQGIRRKQYRDKRINQLQEGGM